MTTPARCANADCATTDAPIRTTGNDTVCLACGRVVRGPAVEAYGRGDDA